MKQIVLVGGGHAHLSVIQDLAHKPIPDTNVILITPSPFQWYSGMLPGLLAGHYTPDECKVDLRPLISKAGITLTLDSVAGMDADRQCVCLSDGTHIEYDYLSLDVGSAPDTSWLAASQKPVLPIKPLDTFIDHWDMLLSQLPNNPNAHIAIVGAGAAGVELALGIRHATKTTSPNTIISLIGTSSGLLPGHGQPAIRRIERILDHNNVTFHPHRAAATEEGLLLSSGDALPIDYILAATGGIAHDWLQLSKLNLDAAGFIAVDGDHRSVSHRSVFAVGDVCSRQDRHLEKSGVHAVHAGPVLAHNLRAVCQGYPSKVYHAKKRSLYLISCGGQNAVMSWGNMSASGAWVWKWKDHIDKKFIKRFS